MGLPDHCLRAKMAPTSSSGERHMFPQDISFSGSGFLATYQLGVVLCLLEYTPWILHLAPCVLGASAGSVIAAAVVCQVNLFAIRDEILQFAKHVTNHLLGPFDPSVSVSKWLEKVLYKYLPFDAHRLASGRLGIALTRVSDGKNLIISDYHSKDDIVQALLCSCFVPGLSGYLPPTFNNVHYIDGGLSSIQPRMTDSSSLTLTICPFSGDADICPPEPPSVIEMVVGQAVLKCSMTNSLRILNGLYPITLKTVEQTFYSGFEDAFNYLQRKDLVPFTINKRPQMSLKFDEASMWKCQEDSKTKLNNIGDKEWTVPPSVKPKTFGEPGFQFGVVKNVLLGNATTHLGMFQLPAKILSNLLLPLIVSIYALLQSRQRMEMLLEQAPHFVFWSWHSMKCCVMFIVNIVVQTLKKSVANGVEDFLLLLQWQQVQPWKK